MSLLELRGLSAGYKMSDGSSFTVLRIAKFTMEAKARVCLKGRSGSGKTTLLNVISGIRLPESGQVLLEGRDLSEMTEAERDIYRGQKIGFVFQTFHLLSGFTALENVILSSVFAGDPHEEDSVTRSRAVKLLEKVGLKDRQHSRVANLSSGEQQRVSIARALMNRPRLILADEPTASLDERNGEAILDLIFRLTEEFEAAVLLVTHDSSVMARFDKVIDLKELNAS